MSWFNRNKKKKGSKKQSAKALKKKSTVRPRGKLHTRRRKRSLLGKMRLTVSVSAMIADALHGDSSVHSSDGDFVKSVPLKFSDGIKYPVMILDEQTLEAAGLGDHEHKHELGQLSVGLKSSSSASGFVPIATVDSLSHDFIGLLPMHDAIAVLRNDLPAFNNYKNGWLVGLVTLSDDDLTLTKTDLRLTMAQWWAFINDKLQLVVDHDHLKIRTGAKSTTDPLSISSQEAAGGEEESQAPISDTDDLQPTGTFEDDDSKASNSNISNFVDSQDQSGEDDSNKNGFEIPDITSEDEESEESQESSSSSSESSSSQVPASADSTSGQSESGLDPNDLAPAVDQGSSEDNNNGDNAQDTEPTQSTQPTQETQLVQAGFMPTQSQDELDAQNAILSNSSRTLNDLKVTISDDQFVQAYINNLDVEPLPMLDDSNDPTGRLHHINALRQQYNLQLQGELKERKAYLRQWFETQRGSILEALRSGTRNKGSVIQKQRKLLENLRKQSGNSDSLRLAAKAAVQEKLDQLDADFDHEKTTAKQQALLNVEASFNDRKQELETRKQDLIDTELANQRQQIATEITDAKSRIQQLAQSSAGNAYQSLMDKGAIEFHAAQKDLQHVRKNLISQLNQNEIDARNAENERVKHQAEIDRHDTEITDLKSQIQDMQNRHQDEINQLNADNRSKIQEIQSRATSEQQSAVSQIQHDLDNAKDNNKSLKQQLEDLQNQYADSQQKAQDKLDQKVEQVQAAADREVEKATRTNKHFATWMGVAAVSTLLLGGAGGFISGELHAIHSDNVSTTRNANANSSSQSQQQAPATQPIIINGQGESHNQDNNSNSNSNKNSNSAHSNTQSSRVQSSSSSNK